MTHRSQWIWTSALAAGLSACVLLAGGCHSNPSRGDAAAAKEDKPAPKIDPKKGMTKQQIITMYQGQPDSKDFNSEGGEVWRYHMNAGQRWIPFNFGYQPEYDTIVFDKDGKVERFTLSHRE